MAGTFGTHPRHSFQRESFYRQVLDLYATSVDYDPRTSESIDFFKIMQNKIHFAAHGHTAAEVISQRANAELPLMKYFTFADRY